MGFFSMREWFRADSKWASEKYSLSYNNYRVNHSLLFEKNVQFKVFWPFIFKSGPWRLKHRPHNPRLIMNVWELRSNGADLSNVTWTILIMSHKRCIFEVFLGLYESIYGNDTKSIGKKFLKKIMKKDRVCLHFFWKNFFQPMAVSDSLGLVLSS